MNPAAKVRACRFRAQSVTRSVRRGLQLSAVFLFVFAAFATLVFSFGSDASACRVAYADSEEDEFSDVVEESLQALDMDAFQGFWDEYGESDYLGRNLKDAVRQVLNGDMADLSDVYALILRMLLTSFLGCLPAMLTVVIICIMKSMLTGLSSGIGRVSAGEPVHFACYAAILTVVLVEVVSSVKTAYNTVVALQSYSNAVFPVLLTLTSALGGTTSMGVYQPAIALLTVSGIGLVTKVTIPLFLATVVFAAVGNMSKSVKLDRLTRLVRGAAEWILGVIFGLFVTVIGVQGAVGAAADKVTVSAARFALSSYVPILGGYLSEGFDLVYAGCILLKNAVGYVGLIALLAVVAAPILKLSVLLVSMKLTAAIVEPLGEKRISDFLSSMSKNMVIILSAIVGVAFLFLVLILLLILSLNIL